MKGNKEEIREEIIKQQRALSGRPEDIYQMILDGDLNCFPKCFWTKGETVNRENIVRCVRYLIEEVLKWGRDEVCDKYSFELLSDYRLTSVGISYMGVGVYKSLELAYPGEYQPWELKKVSRDSWNIEQAHKAMKWLFDEKLKWGMEKIKECLNVKIMVDNGLSTPLQKLYGGSISCMLVDYYGYDVLKHWEVRNAHLPVGYWTDEKVKEAVEWLIKDKLKWNIEDVKKKFCIEVLRENRLDCAYQSGGMGLSEIIESIYGNDIMAWELRFITPGYFNKRENCIKAVKWLEKNERVSGKMLINRLTARKLREYGLRSMMIACDGMTGISNLIMDVESEKCG